MIEIPAHFRLILNDQQHVLLLEQGEVDLFFIEGAETKYHDMSMPLHPLEITGILTYIATLKPGKIILGIPGRHVKLIARANINSSLKQIPKSDFTNQLGAELAINDWIEHFSSYFTSHHLDYPTFQLGEESNFELNKGETIEPKRYPSEDKMKDLHWIKINEGNLHVIGEESLTLSSGQEYPLKSYIWIKSQDKSFIESTKALPKNPWKALSLYHEHILEIWEINHSLLAQRNEIFEKRTKEIDRINLMHAFNELTTVLDEEKPKFTDNSPDLLYKTCKYVWNELKIIPEPLKDTPKGNNVFERVYDICFNSNVFYREIKLIENWWKHDLGPFVGFIEPGFKPVALLPTGKGAYQIHDMETFTSKPVDEESDDSLSVRGFMFYRSFQKKDALKLSEIFSYCFQPHLGKFATVVILGLLAALLELFFPFFTRVIYDLIIPNSDDNLLYQVAFAYIVISVAITIFNIVKEFFLVRVDGLLEHDLQTALWQRILDLPIHFFKKFEIGDLILRASSIDLIRKQLFGPNLRVLLQAVFSIFFIIPMLYYSLTLSIIGLSLTFILVAFNAIVIYLNLKNYPAINHINGENNALVLQLLSGISKIRIAGAENLSFVLWEKTFFPLRKLNWFLLKLNSIGITLNTVVFLTAPLFIYLGALYAIRTQGLNMNLGYIMAFLAAYTFFNANFTSAFTTLINISPIVSLWQRNKVLFDESQETDPTKSIPPPITGAIEIDHLSFRYSEDGPLILDDISFNIKAGEFVAIVGSSGSGKTSLIRLILGFEKQESGGIYFDGKDISTINLRHLRRYIGTVLQSSTILDGTLRQNVQGGELRTDAEILEALNLAGFIEDLKTLPMGLQSIMINGALNFSGGQRQRILIARALIGKPKVLIFDEATSALDNKTQEVVSQNLAKLNVTRIVVAHRLSTIQNADRILVLDRGRIIESGTFRQLIEKDGYFKHLLNRQKLG